MHMGNLLSMLLAWLDIRTLGGRMIFRMEDLDPARSKPEYAKALADDLHWLGLDWDEGWPDPAYSQSQRTALYQEAFHSLEQHNLVYPCYCSRAQRLAASAPHPGEERKESGCPCQYLTAAQRTKLELSGRRPAWKIKVPDEMTTVADGHYGSFSQNLKQDVGDFILRRADGVFAYQLAVSVDDMLMGVTRVVRGHDLLSSAPRQAWLIRTLGGVPPAYCHGPLLVSQGRKLSKRLGSLSTQALHKTYTPEALTGFLAYAAGLLPKPEPIAARELVGLFSWDKVFLQDIPFDQTFLANKL
ncbi:MAG: glutamate--tRNA ligase family protein [Oscillospiraceae bacterium]|nr:glutamate--tRNA ligase family protein [Oscillospiraceae bacterium]